MKNNFSKQEPLTLIGFDYGTKSIGVAIGQTITKTAKPLTYINAQNGIPEWKGIEILIKEWQPNALVVGIPLNMDGTEQKITRMAKKFANQLEKRFNLPVYQVDERLTTVDARNKLFEKGGYRALKKGSIDALAATFILENWMAND